MDYIHDHPWEDLSLHAIGRLTGLTPPYFQRVFKQIVEEPLYHYIRRVRIDKAARELIFDDCEITRIAEGCGFSSLASFSRSFRQLRGLSPSEFRNRYRMAVASPGVDSLAVAQFRKGIARSGAPLQGIDQVIAWARGKVQETMVLHLPGVQILYYRYSGADRFVEQLCSDLYREAARLGCLSGSSRMVILSYDDPFVTADERCRYEVGVTIGEQRVSLPRHAAIKGLSGGKYARLSIAQLPEVASLLWGLVVQEWLPYSGYYLDVSRPAMQSYAHSPEQDPCGRHVFDLYVPVRANAVF